MKFSVIIPLYNKRNHIKETISSVIQQSFEDFELIIVDDGSTDDGLELVNTFSDNRIKIFEQKNSGVSVARNLGINKSSGEFICFLDADDLWNHDYLHEINKLTMMFNESDIFVTAYKVDLPNNKVNYSKGNLESNKYGISNYWSEINNKYEFVWTSATTVRKRALKESGLFKPGENIGQDLHFFSKLARINSRVAFTEKVCVTYNRMAENNARTRIKLAYAPAYMEVLKEEINNSSRSKKELSNIKSKFDFKMIAYIYTMCLSGDRLKAREIIKEWDCRKKNVPYKFGLYVASLMPHSILKIVYGIRLKIF
ncbi:glycosyltransferase family 2 protein [Exiguobacterium acetylicum]|uniref:glycosyltransferase family 2 protein n=1 Tax=Exiguobacterium acetylicum TaxID=41170 RepID=UPI001CA71EAC|nr:glycosyltransferase family 2 protein [Exiguobacterium acetylicum]QZY86425.1 glycosyltransferase family 2 protein [Exiguobacterium acetylicum]